MVSASRRSFTAATCTTKPLPAGSAGPWVLTGSAAIGESLAGGAIIFAGICAGFGDDRSVSSGGPCPSSRLGYVSVSLDAIGALLTVVTVEGEDSTGCATAVG